jgi:acid phosphatase type 7
MLFERPATWIRLFLCAFAAFFALGASAHAARIALKPAHRHGRVLVFELKRVDPGSVESAFLEAAGRKRRVALRRVRKAAVRGRLRVRISRRLARRLRRAHSAGHRRGPRLVLGLADVHPLAAAPAAPPAPPRDAVVTAAGDISCPGVCGQDETAALVTAINPDAVLGLGDYQYDTGTLSALNSYYAPYWGAFKQKTYPINGGSHDFYGTGDFIGYFGSGGPLRLQPEASYSFDVGAWHLIALNSYCFERSSCDEAAWTNWLRADLAAHPARCTLAYFHEPFWTSPSSHGPTTALAPWIQALYDAGVEVVLQAHNHGYERFAPQNPNGARDDARGIQAFTVGTGGRSHYSYSGTAPNSLVKNDDTFGVLKLSLHAASYEWQFVPEPGKTFADAGSAACH